MYFYIILTEEFKTEKQSFLQEYSNSCLNPEVIFPSMPRLNNFAPLYETAAFGFILNFLNGLHFLLYFNNVYN